MSNNSLVGAEAFRTPAKRRFKNAPIQNFGTIRIRSLTEKERCDFQTTVTGSDGNPIPEERCYLAIACIVDKDNKPCLTPLDVAHLKELDAGVVASIASECLTHCGFAGMEEEDIEARGKNSQPTT